MFGQLVCYGLTLLHLPLVVIVGGNRVVSLRVGGSTRNGLTAICSSGDMADVRMARTPKNIGRKFWAATFSNGGVDEKDVIIMTQMSQINDLKKSLKVEGC
ncbi:hypothetical protein DEO72_LG11g3452 [Vigna unguiculata]|uniref:Uncharacterized protein n=1 Tax=Vigna unguiculata TaxID=3917 RepID=A0A4D6NS19_VIGUN|nr:hypothetical protein DEO72_LG11g3452 [Vigna unguiculata]